MTWKSMAFLAACKFLGGSCRFESGGLVPGVLGITQLSLNIAEIKLVRIAGREEFMQNVFEMFFNCQNNVHIPTHIIFENI